MRGEVIIRRKGYNLGKERVEIFPGYSRRKRTIEYEAGKARIISDNLAIYKYQEKTSYQDPRYHVIHILTGLVIADVLYEDVTMVKQTFESEQWTFMKGDYATLHRVPKHTKKHFDTFQVSITCKIRYDVERKDNV